ncbi:MAG TPA: TonB family protein [Candidatus Eisenbacteria bacterium]|nr:TonB family protein [Candidatus Eisenbacteria bacterium]
MPETAQHLLGQLVDGRFPLRRLLGVSPNSAVFLTDLPNERPSEPAPEAAIKLIPEDPETSLQQLARWKVAAALSHPGLIRILHFGRCAMDGSPCLFVVTERAGENLGELLPQRALTLEETSGMMAPVLATLDFLHEKGLVHGGVKPSNILAIRDTIKLSADRILPAGEPSISWPLAAPYAPPESLLFPASDVWSLGISLYETLTQYLPNHDSGGHYVLPQLPSPFAELIRGALVQDPTERISLDDIRAALDPSFVPRPKPVPVAQQEAVAAQTAPVQPEPESAAASQRPLAAAAQASAAGAASGRTTQSAPFEAPLPVVDPLSLPLSPVPPNAAVGKAPSHIPVSSLPNVNVTIAAPRRVAAPRAASGSLKYFLIGAAGTLVLAALIVPRMMRNSADNSAPPSSTAARSGSNGVAAPATKPPAAPERAAPAPPKIVPSPKSSATSTPSTSAARGGALSEAKPPVGSNVPAAEPRSAVPSASSGTPEAVHQVIPDVSEKARSTIRGTVRINVRVQVNPDGTVRSADLNSPASSQFFANLALKAARDWRFAPSANASALLRFDFTNTGGTAYVVR